MSHPPSIHPEYRALLGDKTPTPAPPATDLSAIRATINAATEAASNALPFPAGMTTTVSTVTSTDGTEFKVTRFVPLSVQWSSEKSQRAVIYGFGGGLIAGSVDISLNMIAQFAEQTETQVFAPDYRLAPEHPYPAALRDVYSTITWLQAHAGDFRVDPARIVAFGQSAGGNLMASAALEAKDESLSPPIAALVLRYPMLDDRTQMDPADPRLPYLTWSPSSNAMAWGAYLGGSDKTGGQSTRNHLAIDTVPHTAAPGRVEDLHGLPPTHLSVGGLDLFREETISFAMKLASQDVKVQFNIYPGVPHGFDGHPAFTVTTELWNNEARFIQQF